MSNPNIGKRPYRLVAYDPEWPMQFQTYASQIKKILGNDLLEIHHFGSTSIPGMFAKPNIDIYVLATSLEAVRKQIGRFKKLGLVSRGDYSNIGEEYFTMDMPNGERIASIHIFEGSPDIFDDYKNFKSYLSSNDDERQRYASLKKELYSKFEDNYPAYDAGKENLINELTLKARQWAKNSQ